MSDGLGCFFLFNTRCNEQRAQKCSQCFLQGLSAGSTDVCASQIQKPVKLFLCSGSVAPFGSKSVCIYKERSVGCRAQGPHNSTLSLQNPFPTQYASFRGIWGEMPVAKLISLVADFTQACAFLRVILIYAANPVSGDVWYHNTACQRIFYRYLLSIYVRFSQGLPWYSTSTYVRTCIFQLAKPYGFV